MAAARKIFSTGMMQTIAHGARTRKLAAIASAVAIVAAAAVYASFVVFSCDGATVDAGFIVSLLKNPLVCGSVLSVSRVWWWCGGTVCGLIWVLVFFGWPEIIARDYVQTSLEKDMKDPVSRYIESEDGLSSFWVAVAVDEEEEEEEGSKGRAEGGRSCSYRETIVGTVALEPPTESVSKDVYSPWSVEGGDGELRRMSVKPSHRGRGISKLLFAALREHAKTKGFKRIVLSTSELQVPYLIVNFPISVSLCLCLCYFFLCRLLFLSLHYK